MPQNYKNQPSINRFNFCRWFEDKNLVANGEFELGSGNNFTNWSKTIPTHTNLQRYSQDFSNAFYNNIGFTVTVDDIVAPDGTTTADKMVENISDGSHRSEFGITAFVSGLRYTQSIYVKKGTRDFFYIFFFGDNSVFTDSQVWFNLSNGTLGTVGNGITASIEDAGNGWYRCIASRVAANTATGYIGLGTSILNNQIGYLGTTSDFTYYWGAQLEQSDNATSYIPTTSAPVTADDGEIIAATRTNLLLRSQEFDNASWVKSAGGAGNLPIITPNDSIAPDGTMTADKIVLDSGVGITPASQSLLFQVYTINNNLYTGSIYLKGLIGGEVILFRHSNNGAYVEYTLTTEWQRFENQRTNSDGFIEFGIRQGVPNIINSNVTIYAWGAQIEQSPYASAYIPTSSSAVTVQDGINASRAVRLNRGVTDGLGINYGSLLGAAGTYKLKFWAKTASESSSIKIMSDSSTFDEFEITNRDFQKFEIELDALLADNQLRFFNTTENSSLIIDNVSVDLVQEGANDSIPNPYPLDNEMKYFPLLVNGDKFRFYINADTPLTGLTFGNLRLALYNSDGVRMYSDSNINSLTVGAGIHIYSNDITLSLSSYPDGIYYWAIIDINTGTTKYTSNYFRLVSSGYNDYSTIIEYSHYKTMYNFRYSSISFSNKFRIHILLSDVVYGGENSEYQEISTGFVRKTSALKQRIYKVETYYFDNPAHEAMQIMCEHNTININGKAYLAKGVYSPNIQQISNVSKGEAEFIDQEYSQLNN